jgi:hypothetical protein
MRRDLLGKDTLSLSVRTTAGTGTGIWLTSSSSTTFFTPSHVLDAGAQRIDFPTQEKAPYSGRGLSSTLILPYILMCTGGPTPPACSPSAQSDGSVQLVVHLTCGVAE